MYTAEGAPTYPPGLETLSKIDQLLVHEKVDVVLTGYEHNNKFTIKNKIGQKIYYAIEDSTHVASNCIRHIRPFDMIIIDNFQNEVIRLNHPFACDECCFPCCLQTMDVSAPPGQVIGYIEQEWRIFKPAFTIRNQYGNIVLRVNGPFCTSSICRRDVDFQVMSADGYTQVGKISKQWFGLIREVFTDADYFGVTFPMDLDVRMKAVMLGACFLIDMMFFESSSSD